MGIPRGDPNTRKRILDATHHLLADRTAPPPSMNAIAEAAGVSRQALYLHFGDRGALLLATVDHIDQSGDLDERVAWVWGGSNAGVMLERFVDLVAATSPRIADVARTIDSARVSDPDLEAAWQDRMERRRRTCRELIDRLAAENRLRSEWEPEPATDVLWEITSLRTWEDLVIDRGWSVESYSRVIKRILHLSLTTDPSEGTA